MEKILKTFGIGFVAGILGAFTFYTFNSKKLDTSTQSLLNPVQAHNTYANHSAHSQSMKSEESSLAVDFSVAAAKTIPSVVYINSISQSTPSQSYWDLLFGTKGQQQTQVSSGSGVVFSSDGYIITNNHVVQMAEKIQVIYNKKIHDAELVGTDPSTDLAVLKINKTELKAIQLGSSKNIAVGEWVVAVGNPFSLSSTVTVGVVSAKGRRINVVDDKFPIESFIQTDAAINPGNSGGALVNKNGELVGINTAILSSTGSYTGYAFAVPIDIAKKVVNDIIKFGIVQKAFMGGQVIDYDYETEEKYHLNSDVSDFHGVVLSQLEQNGAAQNAGLQLGDIITQIDEAFINSKSEFEEELSNHYPGDKIQITHLHKGKAKTITLTLVNRDGGTTAIKRKIYSDTNIGASLEAVDYGIKVTKIKDGIFKKIGVPENYTIISLNRKQVKDPTEVIEFFAKYRGRVLLYGITGSRVEYPFDVIIQ